MKYTRPIPYLDDVAADFPDLVIIGAHPGWPWGQEMLATAMNKGNVYLDLSGWKPRYVSAQVWHYANTLFQDKCLFGSDFPFFSPVEWLEDFEKIDIKPEVRQKILISNVRRIFPDWSDDLVAGAAR